MMPDGRPETEARTFDGSGSWSRAFEGLDLAWLLLVIEERLGPRLGAVMSAEDVLQDTLMTMWRGRETFAWQGPRAFRAWVLTIVDHRLCNLAEREGALKRGGSAAHIDMGGLGDGVLPETLRDWSTPSRRAMVRERARAMRRALRGLSPEIAEIVRLRVHEGMTLEEVAKAVGIDEAAVRRKLRKGAAAFQAGFDRELEHGDSSTQWHSESAGIAGNPAPS